MTKRLVAVTGEYVSKQDNQQKAEYTEIGVIITGKNGKDYALLDPAINLAGVLMKQNALAAKRNEPPSDRVMLSVFEQDNQQQTQQRQQPQQGFNQPRQAPPQGYQGQMPQQRQSGQSNSQGYMADGRSVGASMEPPIDFDQEIPF